MNGGRKNGNVGNVGNTVKSVNGRANSVNKRVVDDDGGTGQVVMQQQDANHIIQTPIPAHADAFKKRELAQEEMYIRNKEREEQVRKHAAAPSASTSSIDSGK